MKAGRQETILNEYSNKNNNINNNSTVLGKVNDLIEEIEPVETNKNHVEKKFKNIQSAIKERSSMKSLFSNVKRFFI